MEAQTTYEQSAPRGKSRIRALATAVIIAFLLGGALMFYLAWSSGWIDLSDDAAVAAGDLSTDAEMRAAAPDPVAGTDVPPPTTVDYRIDALERRLNRIDLQAEAASGNAARAEGLLIAFAARRLVERGEPLGYLENQLRLRFGNAQPNAVSTVLAAARNPITLDSLRRRLDDVSSAAVEKPTDLSGWDRVREELSDLFVLRQASAPSSEPTLRVERAEQLLSDGRVEAAAALVARLPNEEQTAPWLRDARRYISIQNALDLIETAALLEPRGLIDGTGQPIRQRSPADPEPPQVTAPENKVVVPVDRS